MTAKDYSGAVAQAVAAVAKYGRPVTLRRLDTTSVTDKPWRGNPSAPVDLTSNALFIGPSKSLNEEFLKDVEDVALIGGDVDLSGYHQLIDNTTVWRIIRQQVLRPGNKTILTYVGIAR